MLGRSQQKENTSYIYTEYRLPGDARDAIVCDIRTLYCNRFEVSRAVLLENQGLLGWDAVSLG